jgi:leucyl-tRNA synthetase
MRYWMPVDIYVGGAKHAVLHLLYARFWIQVMADAGLVPFREPFTTLLNQGQLLGPDGRRMSKSRSSVITPDGMVEKFSADPCGSTRCLWRPLSRILPGARKAFMGRGDS